MRKYRVRIALGVITVALILLHVSQHVPLPLIDKLEYIIYDTRLVLTMPGTLDTRIAILEIDEASLVEPQAGGEGHWPWPRDRLALLLDKLFDQYHVAVVAFDVVFAEADASSGLNVLERLGTGEFKDVPPFQAALSKVRPSLDYDRIFAASMVGEMRDKETVSTGIEASLTGHLVFATLHTNSAPESIVRLLDMGMDPFNFADALLGILAQRLAKRLCKCKEAHVATQHEIELLLDEYSQEFLSLPAWKSDPDGEREKLHRSWVSEFGNAQGDIILHSAKGCEACANTGYKGRTGLHELLIGTDRIKQLIQEHARVAQVLSAALEDGMRTLKQDGIDKVLQGITDVQQVRAVCIK